MGFTPSTCPNEWHSAYTLELDELLECGALSDESGGVNSLLDGWDHYSDEQAARVVEMIVNEYGWREIGVTPVSRWVRLYKAKMQETAQYANSMYETLSDGSILQDSHITSRDRRIDSSFPQTMLNPENADYASYGVDTEHEEIHTGSVLDALDRVKTLKSIDELFLDAVDCLFIHTFAPVVNGF